MKYFALTLLFLSGCSVNRDMPAYFWQHQGKVYYETTLDHPANSLFFTVLGYTDTRGDIHIKRQNCVNYLLFWPFYPSNAEILLHEQIHSFDITMLNKFPKRWQKFHNEFGSEDDEEFIKAALKNNRSEIVEAYLKGKD